MGHSAASNKANQSTGQKPASSGIRWRSYLPGLLAIFALACAAAEPAAPVDRIAVASRLLDEGRIAEARAIVSELRAAPDPDLQVLFLSGGLYLLDGRFEEAAGEFRLMLARDPTLLRPRLELARALFMARQYEAARYHFEQALASPLPEQVRKNVLGYIDAMREHLPSFAFSFELVSDSNPKQATSTKVVQIGNLLFQLNDNARAEEAQGVLFTGQGRFPFPNDDSWFVRGYFEDYDYAGGELDLVYAQALGGKHFNAGVNGIDLEAGGHVATYGGRTLYRGGVWRVSDFIRLQPTLALMMALDAKQLDYPDFPFLEGWQHTVSADLRRVLDPRSSLSGGAAYTLGSADERAYSFERPAVNLRYVREWKGGWISSLAWQYAHYRFGGDDPFFGAVRTDRENLAELGIMNRYLAYKRFAPRLTLGYAQRQSNIELYSYDRVYLRVGLMTEF